MTTEVIRNCGMALLLSATITTTTIAASRRFCGLPKEPSRRASKPPPMLVIPTSMSVSPISVTTVPVTSGVITRVARRMNWLMVIATSEPARQTPKIIPRARVVDAPAAMLSPAVEIIGPRNTKLVPCMLSRPDPTGPIRRVWISVARPDTNNDMLTRNTVSARSSFSALQMINGGVMMPTNTANTCCKATNSVSPSGGLSSRPYSSSAPCIRRIIPKWGGQSCPQPAFSRLPACLPPQSAARRDSFHQRTIPHHRHAVHQHVDHPLGILSRIFKGGAVDHSRGIEHRKVRVRAHCDAPFALDAQALRRRRCHLAQRLHQSEHLLLAHIAAQHAREGAGRAGVANAVFENAV